MKSTQDKKTVSPIRNVRTNIIYKYIGFPK